MSDSTAGLPPLVFARCGVACLGLCTDADDTCEAMLADEARPLPSNDERVAGALRIIKSEKVLMNSVGQIYSGSPEMSEACGNLPTDLIIAMWQAHWQGMVVMDREDRVMCYQLDVNGDGETFLAGMNGHL